MIFRVSDLATMNVELKSFLDFLQSNDVPEDVIFNSRLVSCELITNVIRHCGQTALFEGDLSNGSIHIRVSSPVQATIPAHTPLPDVFAEGGRGLYIVRHICREVRTEDGAVTVNILIK